MVFRAGLWKRSGPEGEIVKLQLLYCESSTSCPTVYVAEDGDLVVQGVVLDLETQSELHNLLPGEVAVKIAPQLLLGAADRYRAATT
jgi:hypothetical protein